MSLSSKTNMIKLAACSALALLASCQPGAKSEKTPIHLNPNMDWQEKYKAQAESSFYEDGRSMRTPVEGTVAFGNLRADDLIYRGEDGNGQAAKEMPSLEQLGWTVEEMPYLEKGKEMQAFLKRGQQRYEIYCTPCHGSTGDAQGIVAKKGYPAVANLLLDFYKKKDVGTIYQAIHKGVNNGNMPSYAGQIGDVKDRWAIVAYVRLLQQTLEDDSKK